LDTEQHIFKSDVFEKVIDECLIQLKSTPYHSLPIKEGFLGAGIYSLFYSGSFEIYKNYTLPKFREIPIYVGKAVPTGWRQGRSSVNTKNELYRRLIEHSKSINCTSSLKTDDFRCKFLIFNGIESNLIGSIESVLIRNYNPLWNSVVDGFGNHDPGKGRYQQSISEWDQLHAGRKWAEKLMGQRHDMGEIKSKIKNYFEDC
jgi:hypothetical protein